MHAATVTGNAIEVAAILKTDVGRDQVMDLMTELFDKLAKVATVI